MCKGIITVFNENFGEKRFVDHIAKLAYKLGLYDYDGWWTIISNKTGDVVGAHVSIQGAKWIVKFLSWITEYRGKNAVNTELKY